MLRERQICGVDWSLDAAAEAAKSAVIRRAPRFQRHLKQLIRCTADVYGAASKRFRLSVIVHGLLNFASHWCGDHSNCDRFVWFCSCTAGESRYRPSIPYVQDVNGNMGQLVRDLIPPMFTYFMTAFILSPSMETRLSRIANNCKTGINESYHHSLAIMIPKWANIAGSYYELLESSAFCAWMMKSDISGEKIKSLRRNKYADTLVASSYVRKPVNEPHLMHFLREILFWSETTVKEVQKRLEWNKRLIEKRADKLMTQVEGAGLIANALGMVPEVKRESSSDGVRRLPAKENLHHVPMPVPPFPFPKANHHCLLVNEELMKLHQSVWDYTSKIKEKSCDDDDDDVTMEIEIETKEEEDHMDI